MNLSMKQNNHTDTENRFVVAQEEEDRGRMDWEFGVSRCKLLHIKWFSQLYYSYKRY